MNALLGLLDILWAYEKLMATSILSNDEKQVVIKELFAGLPHPMHSTGTLGTRDIVAKHLIPPSKDEILVGNTHSPRSPQNTSVPNRDNTNKEKSHKKA